MPSIKSKTQPDDPEQSKRFEETAKQLEADETGNAFERAVDAALPAQKPSSKSPDIGNQE